MTCSRCSELRKSSTRSTNWSRSWVARLVHAEPFVVHQDDSEVVDVASGYLLGQPVGKVSLRKGVLDERGHLFGDRVAVHGRMRQSLAGNGRRIAGSTTP